MPYYAIIRIDADDRPKLGENGFRTREEAERDAKALAEQQPSCRWHVVQVPETWWHVGEGQRVWPDPNRKGGVA